MYINYYYTIIIILIFCINIIYIIIIYIYIIYIYIYYIYLINIPDIMMVLIYELNIEYNQHSLQKNGNAVYIN